MCVPLEYTSHWTKAETWWVFARNIHRKCDVLTNFNVILVWCLNAQLYHRAGKPLSLVNSLLPAMQVEGLERLCQDSHPNTSLRFPLLRRTPGCTGALCCGSHLSEMWPVLHKDMPWEPDCSKALLSLAACVPGLAGQFLSFSTCRIMSDVPPVLSLVPKEEGGGFQ